MSKIISKPTKKAQRNLRELFQVKDYQKFFRDRVLARLTSKDDREQHYARYLQETSLEFSEVNITGLIIAICENYTRLRNYADDDLSRILSVISNFCIPPINDGNLISSGNEGDGRNLISSGNDDGNLISSGNEGDGRNLISSGNDDGNSISSANDGRNLISSDGRNLISSDGRNLISSGNDGRNLISSDNEVENLINPRKGNDGRNLISSDNEVENLINPRKGNDGEILITTRKEDGNDSIVDRQEIDSYSSDPNSLLTAGVETTMNPMEETKTVGGAGSTILTWAKTTTSILPTSDYQNYIESEFGATDEVKELIQVIKILSEDSIQWKNESFLLLLKKSIPRYKDVLDVGLPSHEEAVTSPQICFICRFVPKYLRCFQKTILSWLTHHVSQYQGTGTKTEESRVTVDAVDYLHFVEDGDFGANFLKERLSVLVDACALIEYNESNDGSDFYLYKNSKEEDVFFQFNSKIQNDNSGFFFRSSIMSVSQFCDVISFFASSNVFWPRTFSKKERNTKKKNNGLLPKKAGVSTKKLGEEDNDRVQENDSSSTSVPFFTNKLLYRMVVELQNKVHLYEKKEVFEAIRNIIHVCLYNFFIMILIARLNIVNLLNSEDQTEFIGEMFLNSEKFLQGLEGNKSINDTRDIVIRKLEYYSILLKYCFIAVEHVIHVLGIYISSTSLHPIPSEKDIKTLRISEKEKRLQFLEHLSNLISEKK